MWEISHQWCERIWLIYNLCHDRNMENVTPGMQKNQLQFEASIEKITTVENGTPGMWKRRVQFEASTEKITTVEMEHLRCERVTCLQLLPHCDRIYTLKVWKRQIQFKVSTFEIIGVIIFTPLMWIHLTCL